MICPSLPLQWTCSTPSTSAGGSGAVLLAVVVYHRLQRMQDADEWFSRSVSSTFFNLISFRSRRLNILKWGVYTFTPVWRYNFYFLISHINLQSSLWLIDYCLPSLDFLIYFLFIHVFFNYFNNLSIPTTAVDLQYHFHVSGGGGVLTVLKSAQEKGEDEEDF